MKWFKAIAALSENRIIGSAGKIPWHLPEDFKWFKRMTTGHIIVMGRKTFESIGRPLTGRKTIVLSRTSFSHAGVVVLPDLPALEAAVADDPREVFICGGTEIYAQFLSRCSDLFLTWVKRQVEGDAVFPPFEHLFVPVVDLMDTPDFRITHYQNRQLLIAGG